MDDGCKLGKGLKLSTNSFSYSDCNLLVKVLYDNFNRKASVKSAGAVGLNLKFMVYIWKESMPVLRQIVKSHFIPEMEYKLGNIY